MLEHRDLRRGGLERLGPVPGIAREQGAIARIDGGGQELGVGGERGEIFLRGVAVAEGERRRNAGSQDFGLDADLLDLLLLVGARSL
jgi:hypothetical protein